MLDDLTARHAIRQLYAAIADHYEDEIGQILGVLAGDLARWIAACWQAHRAGSLHDPFDVPPAVQSSTANAALALEVGSGTGVLARQLAVHFNPVVALDLAPEMLEQAQQTITAANVRYLCADGNALPLRRGICQLITASFGLNHTTPKRSLKSSHHALAPNGLLIYQEWGAQDDLSLACAEVLGHFSEAVGETAYDPAIAAYLDTPHGWYEHLQDAEDHYLLLRRLGYALAWAKEAIFGEVIFPSADHFIRYKLAWATRRMLFLALGDEDQHACLAALRAALLPFLRGDGSLVWRPPLIRVCAVR